MKDPVSKQTITLQETTFVKLTSAIIRQMDEFDRVTDGEYSKNAREEAADLKLSFIAFVNKMAQHQTCINLPQPELYCYNDGYGDAIHSVAMKLDDKIAALPPIAKKAVEKFVQAATKVATGKSVKRLGGCSTCGGTKTYDPDVKRQLGRAGKLNSL